MENNTLEIYVDNIIEHYTGEQAVVLNAFTRGDISKEDFLKDVHQYVKQIKVPSSLQEAVVQRYKDFLWAYDVLEPLVQSKDVTDIHCVSWDNIRIKKICKNKTIRETSKIRFDSPKHFRRFVQHLAIKNKINLSEQRAMQNFVDKDSNDDWRLRCNITSEFLTSEGIPFLYIRKEPKKKRSIEDLCTSGMFSSELMPLIKETANGPIIISGASGSGKSIFINALLEVIDHGSNALVIQADDELFSDKHPDIVTMHTVDSPEEDSVSYTFHDIARNAMLLDRQYIIFSEVKGKEARDAFTAAINGINPWLSLHAPNTRASIYQFANYVKMALDINIKDIFRMMAYTPFTLLHLKDFKIDEITYMRGWDEEKKEIIFEDVKL